MARYLRRAVKIKALLRVHFLLTFFGGRGEEQEASALLSKKGGREGSIESQQKFDFLSYDDTPYQGCKSKMLTKRRHRFSQMKGEE